MATLCCDMGILDPAKVTTFCLASDAASIAGLMITTEAMVADKPEDNAAPAGGAACQIWAAWVAWAAWAA